MIRLSRVRRNFSQFKANHFEENSKLTKSDLVGALGVALGIAGSYILAIQTFAWQSVASQNLEANVRYAEIITQMSDALDECQREIVETGTEKKVVISDSNQFVENALVGCRSRLLKYRAVLGVLRKRFSLDDAEHLYEQLTDFLNKLAVVLKEVRDSPVSESSQFYDRLSDVLGDLVDSGDPSKVDIIKIKRALD